jgi:hypothetical protein
MKEHLTVEVMHRHRIAINNPDPSNTRCRKVQEHRASKSARANNKDARV